MDSHEIPTTAPRRWRSTVAGALTGGLLAASIAVPGTWALTRDEEATPAASGATSAGPPSWYGGQPSTQPYSAPSSQPSTTTSRSGNATDAESQGVVLIDTTLTDGAAAGTGLVIDSSGLVLTNYHVVEGSTSVKVTVATDGATYDATVVGFDQRSDIALLRLDGASNLTTVTLDQEDDPAVSDTVTAIGNADGQGYLSAARGTVTGLDASISTQSEGAVLGEHLTGLIETDASVVGGYSGGALLDDEGEVVGVTTAASNGGAAESYAVPIADAVSIADQIEAGDESGDVQIGPSPYLGLGVTETGTGLGVVKVESGSAAGAAGVSAGDVLKAVDGTPVRTLTRLKAVLARHEPGDRVRLRWTGSAGRTHEATATLGSSPVN